MCVFPGMTENMPRGDMSRDLTLPLDVVHPRGPGYAPVTVHGHLVPVLVISEGAERGQGRERRGGRGRRRGPWAQAAHPLAHAAHDRPTVRLLLLQRVQLPRAAPRRRHEDDHRHHHRPADGRRRRDGDLVHVAGRGAYGAHLAALPVRHGLRGHVQLLQGHHAYHDAFLQTTPSCYKRQSVTAKRKKSQTPKFVTAMLT